MVKLLLVDDHPIFLDGLRQFLQSQDDFEIHIANSVDTAIQAIASENPDLLLLDVSMDGGGGLRILELVREQGSDVPVVFLTVHITPADTLKALRLDINGIVLKESDPSLILQCIRKVLNGEVSVDRTISDAALRHSIDEPKKTAIEAANLTDREHEIVELVGQGLRNKDIAEKCGLTEGTIKTHLHNVFRKMNVGSRTQLILAIGKNADS